MSVPLPEYRDEHPTLLLACEGQDDRAFLRSILFNLSILHGRIDIYGGKPSLPRYLRGLRDSSDFGAIRALGIVRDGDDDPGGAWQSVTDRLGRLNLFVPTTAGRVQSGASSFDGIVRSIGVFIMPDGQAVGALEDLCLRAIEHDPAIGCVEDFLTCVRVHSGVTCATQDISKARLNAWLASRSDPTLRLGHAISSRDISPDSDAFGPIRQFLADLAEAATRPATESDDV